MQPNPLVREVQALSNLASLSLPSDHVAVGVTTLDHNVDGDPDLVVDAENSTTFSYDALNRKTGTTDALGDLATYVYNSDGDMTQNQEPTPAGQIARTTIYTYNSMNRLTVTTDPLGDPLRLGPFDR